MARDWPAREIELDRSRRTRLFQTAFALVAVLFGVATLVAGARVLAGSDPGYVVFRPLLVYNTAMGLAYVLAGVMAWRNLALAKYAALAIFILNLLVLVAIAYLYAAADSVAVESLRAMSLRTVVWLALFLGLARIDRATAAGKQGVAR